jgi:methylenetetrahydrofolate dehydrogenase (NADP+)/methenyltetrahydrofolate cyclohydrolase
MYLVTILAFGVLFWQSEWPGRSVLVDPGDIVWTLLAVLVQPPLLGGASWLAARRGRRLLAARPDTPQIAQRFHHRAMFCLRMVTILGFASSVLLTRWPEWLAFGKITPALQIVGDLIVLSPFVAALVAIWVGAYPLERTLRAQSLGLLGGVDVEGGPPWRLRSYLDFNLRHHVLIVAVPMTLILFAADLARGYERSLQVWSGWAWTPDVLLGGVALGVFLVAPIMLTRIWRTDPLEAGPERERLETLCRRIGMRCRGILVWRSGEMMINAAVMGLIAPVRYVLLSDGLLATMSIRQIEAVFAHEAGHVRHHHMQHFLVFAFVGWLLAAGTMEILVQAVAGSNPAPALPPLWIQGLGVAATIAFWGIGFGWLSRRFERQADLFGARCVTPTANECRVPCSVHITDQSTWAADDRVCATGVAVFTSALDRVAVLSGIPHEERNWRHSSIGSRIRFLTSLAGDPARVARFNRLIRRVKTGMLTVAIIGLAICVYYWSVMAGARIIDGGAVARRIKQEAETQVRTLAAQGVEVSLDAVIVGDPEVGGIYARSQRKQCEDVGIRYRLHVLAGDAPEARIRRRIHALNEDQSVTGILLNLPLPPEVDTPAIQYCIDPYKDVEGVNPANIGLLFYDSPIIAPCTALAVMEILKEAQVDPRGLDAVVVGQGAIAGKPVSLFLLQQMATVTCCHIATRNLYEHTRRADLVIVAVGKPGLIRAEHVKPGAMVIDVGINTVVGGDGKRKIVGDVAFDEVKQVAGVITPVPGGVGPVTVAVLLRSAAEAAAKQLAEPRRVEV